MKPLLTLHIPSYLGLGTAEAAAEAQRHLSESGAEPPGDCSTQEAEEGLQDMHSKLTSCILACQPGASPFFFLKQDSGLTKQLEIFQGVWDIQV